MPGAQPRGTHSFDPGSISTTSATQALDSVNAEKDGVEDRAGPSVDTAMANAAAASEVFTSAVPSIFLPVPDLDEVSDTMPPPSSSSVSESATTHPDHVSPPSKHHIFIKSVLSGSQTTSSDARTTSSKRKRKRERDATGLGDMLPPSSKRVSKNKTETLNPVIISSQLNSTLNRLADVMEKSLDVTSTSIEVPTTHTAPLPSSSSSSAMPSQLPGPPSSTPSSDSEVLDKALGIVTAFNDTPSEDLLFAASIFFSNTSNEVVRIARNFIALSDTPAVQRRFIIHQLKHAGLYADKGKGKGKAMDDDFPMLD